MRLGFFFINKEEMNERHPITNTTSVYDIFIPQLFRMGFGIRVNFFNHFLVGTYLTNTGLDETPEPPPVLESSRLPEQLKLPFDD